MCANKAKDFIAVFLLILLNYITFLIFMVFVLCKLSHTRYLALGPELILVYRQSL